MPTRKKESEEEETPEEKEISPEEIRRSNMVSLAIKQIEEGLRFKQPRMNEIIKNEEVYLGKERQALVNRFNVPFDSVVMQGAIDTTLAKTDDAPKLSFDALEEEYKRSSMKVTAVFEKESGDAKGRWASKDRQAKRLAYLSGRAIFEKYTHSSPKFEDVLKVEDHYNFYCEPGGGSYLEDHVFLGTINNFFTKEQLKAGAKSGLYIGSEVQKLINGDNKQHRKEVQDEYGNMQKRFQALGLDYNQHNYIGESIFNLTKHEMVYEGKRYYLLIDVKTQICVRCIPIEDISPSGRWTWVSWATHEDMIFWSRSFADSIRPIAEVYRVLVNQMLENINKRNWNMRAYDPSVFTDSAKLLYSPDGLVKANLKPGMTSVGQGIFELSTPETSTVTLNAIEWLNSFLGEKIGVGPNEQGNSQDQRVGIYFGNVQQAAERFGLLNKQYTQAWIDLGVLFDWGLYHNVPSGYMVQVLGIEGVTWEELKVEDVDPDFQVQIVSSNAQAAESELKSKKHDEAIARIMSSASLMANVSPRWLTEEILRGGAFTESDIKVAMDTQTEASRDVILRAAESIRKIVDGEWPVKICYAATTGFIQKIINYANEHYEDISKDIFDKLFIYAEAHKNIVIENMRRKAMTVAITAPPPPSDPTKMPAPTGPTISPTPTTSATVQGRMGM